MCSRGKTLLLQDADHPPDTLQGSFLGEHFPAGTHCPQHCPQSSCARGHPRGSQQGALRSCKMLLVASLSSWPWTQVALMATPRAHGNPAVPSSLQLPDSSHILPLSLPSQTQALAAITSQNPGHTKSSPQFGQLRAGPSAAASAPVGIYRKQNHSSKRNQNKNPTRAVRSSPSPFTAREKLSRDLTTFSLMDEVQSCHKKLLVLNFSFTSTALMNSSRSRNLSWDLWDLRAIAGQGPSRRPSNHKKIVWNSHHFQWTADLS